MPKGDEFHSGKPCMPDVFVDNDGVIKLQFAIKHNAPEAYEPNGMLGVDVGTLYPYTAAIVMPDGTHSQTVYPDEKIMNNVDLIDNLLYQKGRLIVKIDQNDRPARAAHTRELAERQKVEKERLAARVSTVKRRVCQDVAHRVVGMALQHRAGIALEKLNWSSPSHGFYHNLIHDDIINLAHRCGVPVKMVSATGTSSKCPFDGAVLHQRLKHNPASSVSPYRPVREKGWRRDPYLTRGAECDKCNRVFDHDGVSPLSIGARACLDRKRASRVSRQVFRLRFRNVSLRCLATSAADDTPVVAGPSNPCVSGNPTVAAASSSGVAGSAATPELSPDCQINHESSLGQSIFIRQSGAVKPSYRSIDEIYDEVIAECHSQSCSMRRAESRFSDHERYTDEEIARQRREVEEYGGVARISVGDDNDDSISLHDGEKIAIIGEARHYNPKAFGTQWRVRFEDGTMSVVFSDELSKVA